MNGDIAGARKLIAITPGDCYTCLRLRGKIDTVAKNWGAAAYWFASATRAAPSIPFAYTDWGQMLMATRNYDGAIAMFKVAAEKGPHFADPLELWGEALIAQNHSDLALAKFADAQNYAPHWGRLYLEWGESLDYVGRHDEAQSKYAAASVCDINPADRARLTDLMTRRLVPAPIRQR
jgi:tetratricopeptide (TPR) repeat protein